jgi:hypothetical protein
MDGHADKKEFVHCGCDRECERRWFLQNRTWCRSIAQTLCSSWLGGVCTRCGWSQSRVSPPRMLLTSYLRAWSALSTRCWPPLRGHPVIVKSNPLLISPSLGKTLDQDSLQDSPPSRLGVHLPPLQCIEHVHCGTCADCHLELARNLVGHAPLEFVADGFVQIMPRPLVVSLSLPHVVPRLTPQRILA